MADSPTCGNCGGVASSKGALCRKELAEKAAKAQKKRGR